MAAFSSVLALLATLAYLLTAALLARALAQRALPRPRLTSALMATGILLHGLLVQQMLQPGGLHLDLFRITLLHGWLVALLAWLMTLWRPVQGLFLIAAPLAALELFVASLGLGRAPSGPALPAGLGLHVLLSILAYGVLSIAALQAVLVSWQNTALRRHRRGLLMALPALETMESMLFELIAIGVGLLSLAIVTGAVMLEDPLAQQVAHKTVFTLVAWLLFAGLLLGRYWRGWRGRTAVRITLSGFVLLLTGFIGSKLVLELILRT